MGNSLSNNIQNNSNHDNESLLKEIDEIATKYIFKQNMVDMLRFSDKEYRENFVILTCHILEKKLSNVHIDALKDRVLNSERNRKNTNYGEILYFSELEKLKPLLSDENAKKKALLFISKFYIKVFTLFGSIVSVIDPQYIYIDENGEEKFFHLKDFDDLKMIDTNTNKLRVYHLENPLTLIKRRLSILKNKMEQQENGDYIVINPGEELCKMNISENNNSNSYYLSNEIGIKELDSLYYDLYDEHAATWSGRSSEMEEQYERDVTLFYQIFTGKKDKPSSVKSFGDIEMLDFHNLKRCKNNDYFEDLLVSKNDELFQKYLTKIEEIQEGTRSYKKQLLYILKSLFSKKYLTENPEEYEYTIHPELNMDTLLEKQKQLKNCIVQMYSSCERNFIEALLLYEKMYENKHGELVEAQINNISFSNNNINRTNVNNNVQEQTKNNNVILNDDLLLDNKIKMPKVNNNEFKLTNMNNQAPQMAPQENANVPMETTNNNTMTDPAPLPNENQAPQMAPQENTNVPMETTNNNTMTDSALLPNENQAPQMAPQENTNVPMETTNNNTMTDSAPLPNENQAPQMAPQENANDSMEVMSNISSPPPAPLPNNQGPQLAPQEETDDSMEVTNNNTMVSPPPLPNNNEAPDNANKISMQINSTNNKLKNKNENNSTKSITEKSEEAQRSIINGLSNFFS